MPTHVDVRREAARGFFEFLERELRADEVLGDKQCVRMIIEKARTAHSGRTRKRFDAEGAFRAKLLYDRIDDALTQWCRRREIKADPFKVFRYEGPERGPTQHETAIGPSLALVERAFDRLAANVPEFPDCRAIVAKRPTAAIAPAFRLQHPLPFGAVGEVKYEGTRTDLARSIYQVTMYAATTGDPSRGWRYDCGVLVFFGVDRTRTLLGDQLADEWPDIHRRIWEAGRVWVILL